MTKPRVSALGQSGATTGQAIVWNGTTWAPASIGLHASRSFNTASSGNNTLTLAATPYEESLQVFVDGLLKRYSIDYTLSGTTVTFTSALTAGQVVADHYWTTTASPGDSTLSSGATVLDSFNRADNASSLGTADTGQTWTALSGTWGISSNKAYKPGAAGQGFAVIDSALANCTVQATLGGTIGSGGTGGGGVAFRMTNSTNGWFTEADGSTGYLYKVVSGTFTAVATYSAWTVGDVVSVVLSGSSITVKRNGTTVATATDSFNSTATKHGLRDYGGNIRLDSFSVA